MCLLQLKGVRQIEAIRRTNKVSRCFSHYFIRLKNAHKNFGKQHFFPIFLIFPIFPILASRSFCPLCGELPPGQNLRGHFESADDDEHRAIYEILPPRPGRSFYLPL